MRLSSGDTAEYFVGSCYNCGVINIMPKHRTDGNSCAACGGGPMKPLGYGIMQGSRLETIHVGVDVNTSQLDKVKDLIDSIDDQVDRITNRLTRVKGELMKIEGADI